ncbi:hypothetical protein LCGC14_0110410 [marine sediment metagenome]|uniref:Uncharacterized protein n=1 Tax=marine sediment metagenome TaxID=412755 RepID=A0A0F9VAH6_9ZZZZ
MVYKVTYVTGSTWRPLSAARRGAFPRRIRSKHFIQTGNTRQKYDLM